jgi:MFS family permease
LLVILTVVEPKSKDAILLTKDENKKKDTMSEANKVLSDENKDGEFEVKEVKDKVVLKKKRKGCKDLCSDYKRHFYLMFTNLPAMMVITGSIFRLFQSTTIQFYLGEYMKVYSDDYVAYSELAALAAFIGGPISTFLCGLIIDVFGKKTEMIIPIILVAKSLLSIPIGMLMFYQQKSFTLAIVGIFLEVTIGRGWNSSVSFMLINVVDPEIAYLGVSLLLILSSVLVLVVAEFNTYYVTEFDIAPLTNPTEYGNLITSCCVFPLLLSVPFFLYSGFVMRNIKRAKMADTEVENKKASIYIKNEGVKENLYSELKDLKKSVKHKMSYH